MRKFNFIANSNKLFSVFWIVGILFSITGVVVAVMFISVTKTGAQIARFYPTTCLGGWQNTHLVQDAPDAEAGFSADNSAILENTQAQIFCSGFTGELPPDAVQQQVLVRLSWGFEDISSELSEIPITDVATTTIVSDESNASTTEAILNVPEGMEIKIVIPDESSDTEFVIPAESLDGDAPEEMLTPDTEPITEIIETPVEEPLVVTPSPEAESEPSAEPITEPTSEPTGEPSPEPISLRSIFFRSVSAQEVELIDFIATSSEDMEIELDVASTTPTISVQEIELIDSTATPSEAMEAELDTASTTPAVDMIDEEEYFFEVMYTLDGVEWKTLGKVSDLKRDSVFEIPLTVFNTPDDLSKVQIAVHSLITLNERPTVFLDSMWLEVEYSEKASPLLSVRNFEKNIIIDSEATHRCEAEVFRIDISSVQVSNARIILKKSADILIEPTDSEATSTQDTEFVIPAESLDGDAPEEMLTPDTEPITEIIETPVEEPLVVTPSPEAESEPSAEPITEPTSEPTGEPSPEPISLRSIFFRSVSAQEVGAEIGSIPKGSEYEVEIGGLPNGIDVRFLNNNGYLYTPDLSETFLDLEIINQKGSQKGDFTIPIIYTKKGIKDSSVICQINIVNK